MGFISFKKWAVILILLVLLSYYANGFRLIHTSQQSHDSKKSLPEKKIHVLDSDDSDHEENKTDTIKFDIKKAIIEEIERIKHETPVIIEKKILPISSDTKENIATRAKELKESKDIKIETKKLFEKAKPKLVAIEEDESDEVSEEIPKPKMEKHKEEVKIAELKDSLKVTVKESIKKIEKDADKPKAKAESKKTPVITELKDSLKDAVKETIKKIEKDTDKPKAKAETKKTPVVQEKDPKETQIEKQKAKTTVKDDPVKKPDKVKMPSAKDEESKENKIEKQKPKPTIKEEPVKKAEKDVVNKPKETKVETPVEKPSKEIPKAKPAEKPQKIESTPKKIVPKEEAKSKPIEKQQKEIIAEKVKETPEEKPQKPQSIVDFPKSELYYNFPSFSPNFDVIENEECKKQGRLLVNHLNNHKMWALRMLDSTAKIPSGLLKGNINQFGDYDQCINIFAKVPDSEKSDTEIKITGKYCLANIDFEAKIQEMKLPVNLAQGRTLIRSKIQDPGHFIPRFTTARWGLCIPSGCTAEDAEKILENSIKMYNDSSTFGLNINIDIDADQCSTRKPPRKLLDINYAASGTIGLTISIILIASIATLRDIRLSDNEEQEEEKQEAGKLEQVFMSFSLKRTLETFLRQESEPEEIECIHGIRTICTFILYIAHKLIPIGHMPFTNKVTLTEMSNSPFSVILRMSVIYTDTFLLLSGVLTSYSMSKDMEVKGRISWFNRILARFIRLTPSLFMVLIYYAYVIEILGEGPLWNTVITPNAELCKENWWKNMLFIQNIYPFQEICATHTHQLALDMQLSLIAPVLVWLLYRRPLLGVFTTLLLHSVSVILRYYTTVNYRLSLVIYHGISISQLYRTANFLYASSIHRATPYLAGIGLGVLLRQMKPNSNLPKILTIIGWIIAGYFASWCLYTPANLASRTYQYDIDEAAQYAALCSLAWALALSWIIFASHANNDGYINAFLSSRPMVLLSRISYTVYLTQFMVFFYNVGSLRTAPEFKLLSSLDLSELLITIVISTALTLLVDLPMQKIKYVLLRSKPTENSEVSTEYNGVENHENKNNARKLSSDSQQSHEHED